ncbi:MAG: DUF4239 domain-containing protein [Aestuariivirga sp.]
MPPDFLYSWSQGGVFLFLLLVTGLIACAMHGILLAKPVKRAILSLAALSPVLQTLCGTLFVLSVTFLASTVWHTEDRAGETVNTEARSIRVIHTYLDQMTGPSQESLSRLIIGYAKATADEWDGMAQHGGSPAAEEALSDLYSAVVKGFSEGETNRLLQQRLLAALDTLSLARAQRLSMANDFVSSGQWFTVFSLGFLLLIVIAVCHAQSAPARAAALTFTCFAIALSVFVIIAHDRPFVGRLAIQPQPILDAAGLSA